MTENDLRKLSRVDLLEMLIAQSKENEALRTRIEELERQLESRTIAISNAGSIAEASLKLNHVFETAQAAAEQFLESIRLSEQQSRDSEKQSQERCARMLEEAEAKAKELTQTAEAQAKKMTETAEEETEAYWTNLSRRLERLYGDNEDLQELLRKQMGE